MLRMPPQHAPQRHALWTVITLHLDGSAALGTQALSDLHDLLGRERPGAIESQSLPGASSSTIRHCRRRPSGETLPRYWRASSVPTAICGVVGGALLRFLFPLMKLS
jgi:hypothetical protein